MATTTTLGDVLTEFFARGLDYLNDGTSTPVRATRWLNQAQRLLCTRADFPFLFADSSGTGSGFSLVNPEPRVILSVYDSTQKLMLQPMDRETLLETFRDNLTGGGSPRYWYRDAATAVKTYPVANDTINIRYVGRPAWMTQSTDVLTVPDEWADLVVDLAVLKGKKDDDDYDQYAQQVEADIARMIQAELDDNSAPTRVKLVEDVLGGDW